MKWRLVDALFKQRLYARLNPEHTTAEHRRNVLRRQDRAEDGLIRLLMQLHRGQSLHL